MDGVLGHNKGFRQILFALHPREHYSYFCTPGIKPNPLHEFLIQDYSKNVQITIHSLTLSDQNPVLHTTDCYVVFININDSIIPAFS